MPMNGLPLIAVDVSTPVEIPVSCPTDDEARRNSFDADEVIPGIFVGSTRIAARPAALVHHNIRRILNLSGKPIRPPGSPPLFVQVSGESLLVAFVPYVEDVDVGAAAVPQMTQLQAQRVLEGHQSWAELAAASLGESGLLDLGDSQRSQNTSIGCFTPMHSATNSANCSQRTFYIEVYDVAVSDRLSQCMIEHFDKAHRFIHSTPQCETDITATSTAAAAAAGDSSFSTAGVAICCKEGTSRSVTVACSFIMKRLQVSNDVALAMVQRARRCAAPNIAFLGQLYAYYKCGCDAKRAVEQLQHYTDEFLANAAAAEMEDDSGRV